MRKITIALLASIALLAGSATSFAGSFGVGLAGSIANVNATGSETSSVNGSEQETKRAADIKNDVLIPAVYVEYTMDMDYLGSLTLGYEHVPGSADVSNSIKTRTDGEKSKEGTTTSPIGNREFKAQAEMENLNTVYAEIPFPLFDLTEQGAYVRLGFSQVDVNTQEVASGNGGSYGNVTIDGFNYGFGFKNNMTDNTVMKLSYEATDFDDINLTSTGNTTNSGTNQIAAQLDTWAIKLAIGYEF